MFRKFPPAKVFIVGLLHFIFAFVFTQFIRWFYALISGNIDYFYFYKYDKTIVIVFSIFWVGLVYEGLVFYDNEKYSNFFILFSFTSYIVFIIFSYHIFNINEIQDIEIRTFETGIKFFDYASSCFLLFSILSIIMWIKHKYF